MRPGLTDVVARAERDRGRLSRVHREKTNRIHSGQLSRDEMCRELAERQVVGGMIRELWDVETTIRGKRSPAYVYKLREVLRYRSLTRLTPHEEKVIDALLSGMNQEEAAKHLGIDQWNVSMYCHRAIEKMDRAKEISIEARQAGLKDDDVIMYMLLTRLERKTYMLIRNGKTDEEIAELTGTKLETVKRRRREIERKRKAAENCIAFHTGDLCPFLTSQKIAYPSSREPR